MKRSEMLKLIEVQLLEDDTNQMIHGDGRDLTYEEMAKISLKVIEKQGMLPPLNEDNYHFMDSHDRQCVNEAKNFYFKWEKE